MRPPQYDEQAAVDPKRSFVSPPATSFSSNMSRFGFLLAVALIMSGCAGNINTQQGTEVTDRYFTANGEEDGLPLIFRARQNIPIGANQSDFPHQVLVEWYFDASENNGMPLPDTNEAQVTFEDALASFDDGAMSYLMLVVTGNGRKFWYWYVRDVPAWLEKLNDLLTDHPVYPIGISDSLDPEWSVWSGLVSNTEGL